MDDPSTNEEEGRGEDSQPSGGSVVMLSGDLMFASRVRAAAQGAGLTFHFGGSLPDADLRSVRYRRAGSVHTQRTDRLDRWTLRQAVPASQADRLWTPCPCRSIA